MRTYTWLLVALLAACEGDPNPAADTTAPDTVVVDTVVVDTQLPDTAGQLCIPDRHFCTSPRESALCSVDGKSIAETTPCLGQTACDANTGLCAAAICEPASTSCVGLHQQQICKPDGSGYYAVQPCDDPLYCAQGKCRACSEDKVECLSDTTYRRCAADASAWSDTLDCANDYRCVPSDDGGAACKSCGFERVCLTDSKVRTRCTSGEIAFQEDITCGVGTTCMDGYCRACEPSLSQCLSETTVRSCAADGSAWSEPTLCPPGDACLGDKCLPYGCSPRVLFLVDYSGSMQGAKWDAVASSVATLVAANPTVRFGMKTFPDVSSSFGCDVSASLEIDFGTEQADTFAAWFAAHDPPGATPLAAGLTAIADHADTIFGPLGGYVIMLSDGEDSCYYGNTEPIRPYLAETAARLAADGKVQTYGIAYGFDGGEAGEMDTVAKNGGTGEVEAIDAGSEDELSDAFDRIIDKVKFCDGAP